MLLPRYFRHHLFQVVSEMRSSDLSRPPSLRLGDFTTHAVSHNTMMGASINSNHSPTTSLTRGLYYLVVGWWHPVVGQLRTSYRCYLPLALTFVSRLVTSRVSSVAFRRKFPHHMVWSYPLGHRPLPSPPLFHQNNCRCG